MRMPSVIAFSSLSLTPCEHRTCTFLLCQPASTSTPLHASTTLLYPIPAAIENTTMMAQIPPILIADLSKPKLKYRVAAIRAQRYGVRCPVSPRHVFNLQRLTVFRNSYPLPAASSIVPLTTTKHTSTSMRLPAMDARWSASGMTDGTSGQNSSRMGLWWCMRESV